MAEKKLVHFESAVEKLVADYASNVNDKLEDARKLIDKEITGLYGKVKALKVPKDIKDDEVNDIISSALQSETKRIKNLVDVTMKVKVDGEKLKGSSLAVKGLLSS